MATQEQFDYYINVVFAWYIEWDESEAFKRIVNGWLKYCKEEKIKSPIIEGLNEIQ